MPLVAAKCTQCGAELQVDSSQEAAVCQHCGTPFIVEKAINNYNTYVTQNFAGANVTIQGANIDSYIERAFMFLEEKKWESAFEYAEKSLDIEPKCTKAYIIKYMARRQVSKVSDIVYQIASPETDSEFAKAIKYDDGTAANILEEWYQDRYKSALGKMNNQVTEVGFRSVAEEFDKIKKYKDSAIKYNECISKAEEIRTKNIIIEAEKSVSEKNLEKLNAVLKKLHTVTATEKDGLIDKIQSQIKNVKKKRLIIGVCTVAVCIAMICVGSFTIRELQEKNNSEIYNQAYNLYQNKEYKDAKELFGQLADYGDSRDMASKCGELLKKEQEKQEDIKNFYKFIADGKFVQAKYIYNRFKSNAYELEEVEAEKIVTEMLEATRNKGRELYDQGEYNNSRDCYLVDEDDEELKIINELAREAPYKKKVMRDEEGVGTRKDNYYKYEILLQNITLNAKPNIIEEGDRFFDSRYDATIFLTKYCLDKGAELNQNVEERIPNEFVSFAGHECGHYSSDDVRYIVLYPCYYQNRETVFIIITNKNGYRIIEYPKVLDTINKLIS